VLALAASADIVNAIHDYGGLVFNDIISEYHARKCAQANVDGLIAVAAGAGGHTGNVSPFALVTEIRERGSGNWRDQTLRSCKELHRLAGWRLRASPHGAGPCAARVIQAFGGAPP
jgi:hypothetical protein